MEEMMEEINGTIGGKFDKKTEMLVQPNSQ